MRRIYRWGNNAITLEDNSIEIDVNKRATTTHTSTKKKPKRKVNRQRGITTKAKHLNQIKRTQKQNHWIYKKRYTEKNRFGIWAKTILDRLYI